MSQWADRYAYLSPESSAEPGRWHTLPYQRAILDAFTAPEVERITLQKSARIGWTKSLNWAVAYGIHQDPASQLIVQPTVEDAEGHSKDEIAPMLRDVPALEGLVSDPRSRDSSTTITRKSYPGGTLFLVGANSARGFRRITVKRVFFDEVDAYPPTAGQEGDQIELGIKRTGTFWDRKIAIGSTPTVKGASRIEATFERSSRGYCYVPCPHCGERHTLDWERFSYDPSDYAHAGFACPHCGALYTYADQRHMVEQCIWIGEHWRYEEGRFTFLPGFRGHIGFFIWSAYSYSPDAAWPKLAERYEGVKGDPEKLRTFWNVELGRTYELRGEAPEQADLLRLAGGYTSGTVPAEALKLTAGVDVQKYRLYYVIRAWGERGTSWLVSFGELVGDTDKPAVWSALDSLLDAGVNGRRIDRMAIDSGYRTDEVYAFVRAHKDQCIATKGKDHLGAKLYFTNMVDVNHRGQIIKLGVKLWTFDADKAKTWVHNRINWPPDQPGAWTLPDDITDDYAQQITAEERVVDKHGLGQWIKVRQDNHYLDCFSADTELLTRYGWVSVTELSERMKFATVNLDTDEIEYQRPTALIEREHIGDMISIRGRRIDVLVTPNHRMVARRYKEGGRIVLAKDLDVWDRLKLTAKWTGIDAETLKVGDAEVDAGDWMEFLGWFVSEGHRSEKNGTTHKVVITQNPGEKQDRIKSLLDRLPWQWNTHGGRQMVIYNRELYDALNDCYVPGNGRGCYRKKAPMLVKNSSPRLIARFIESAVLGDGWEQKGFRTYATTSQQLADDMQELFIKLGNSANIIMRNVPPAKLRGKEYPTVPQFHISELKTKTAHLRQSDNAPLFKTIPYSGMVYCVTVPNGTLIARRNGKPIICGNCEALAYIAAHTINAHDIPPPVTKPTQAETPTSSPERTSFIHRPEGRWIR